MEDGDSRPKSRRRRKARSIILSVVAVIVVIVIVALVLGLTHRTNAENEFKPGFIARCEKFKEYDCQKVWTAFEQAYVGKDPCNVPPEAYNAVIAAAPIKTECNRGMFWSKTKGVVHDLTAKRDCYVTLEDIFLGSVLDGLTWCGKKGSPETFTTGCPEWSDCDNNPVRSFWNQASAAYAHEACGEVSVMLNGTIATPFSPTSTFASVEVKHFNPAIVKTLNVVLVTQEKEGTNCTNASLKDLQKELPEGIAYNCKEVAESKIHDCASHPEKPCGSCW